jgi:hypothetical protein
MAICSCATCGATFQARPANIARGWGRFCSRLCAHTKLSLDTPLDRCVVWRRLADPDYYAPREPKVYSPVYRGQLLHISGHNLKCICGACGTCLRRSQQRRYYARKRESC